MASPPDGRDLELMAQARLAGRAAHHFNNCLAVIIANLEMAVEDAAAGRPYDPTLSHQALDAARRAAATCRKLQDFARPPGAPPSPLSLESVLAEMAATRPHIEIEAADANILVLAEESELISALHTLAAPSTPFILKRGRLVVRDPPTDPDWVTMTMEGDGRSPPPDALPSLFEPLTGHAGHDIDLSQVWSMIRRAGGRIDAALDDEGRLIVHLRLARAPSGCEG
ncbi:MAG: hypothetical protein EPN26_11155 [Rhodospirillales bacterium]|nr:MAG: hypothetical protein EPN26_11155 [Rhodospirillales bacterium]